MGDVDDFIQMARGTWWNRQKGAKAMQSKTETKHTPGPWRFTEQVDGDRLQIIGAPKEGAGLSELVATIGATGLHGRANARHIVACVNACEGLNPEAVPDMLKTLRLCVIRLEQAATRLRQAGYSELTAQATMADQAAADTRSILAKVEEAAQ